MFASGNCEAISLPPASESTVQVVTICAASGKGGTASADFRRRPEFKSSGAETPVQEIR